MLIFLHGDRFVEGVGDIVAVGVVVKLGALVSDLVMVRCQLVFVLLLVLEWVGHSVGYVRPLSMRLVVGYFLFQVRSEVCFLVVAGVRCS